jgi:hypothetical protein
MPEPPPTPQRQQWQRRRTWIWAAALLLLACLMALVAQALQHSDPVHCTPGRCLASSMLITECSLGGAKSRARLHSRMLQVLLRLELLSRPWLPSRGAPACVVSAVADAVAVAVAAARQQPRPG